MRTAELEIVRYDTEKILKASKAFVSAHNEHMGGAEASVPRILHAISAVLDAGRSSRITWRVPGSIVSFSGIPPILPLIEDSQLVYKGKSPHFILEEEVEAEVRADSWQMDRFAEARHLVTTTMHDVYGLEVVQVDSLTILNFPKDQYAESIQMVSASILNR